MVTIPAWVWRYGAVGRALLTGSAVGLVVGALAWVDSGVPMAGVAALVTVGIGYGIGISRRMTRYWPAGSRYSGRDRVAVARAARAGHRLTAESLHPAVVAYRDGMHAAAVDARPLRWALPVVLAVAVAMALWDAAFGSAGNAAVSLIYLLLLGVELWWWPGRRARLLTNADAACAQRRAFGTPPGA